MTQDEYIEWGCVFSSHFPLIAEWHSRQDAGVDAVWFSVLQTLTLAEAKEATRRLYENGLPDKSTWQDLPRLVRDEAVRRRPNRPAPCETESPKRESVLLGFGFNVAEFFREMREAETQDDRAAVKAKYIAIMDQMPNHRPRRYRCLVCMDVGAVAVWHPETISKYKDGFRDLCAGTLTVPCFCGQCKDWRGHRDNRDRYPTYDEKKHCRRVTGKLEELEGWLSGTGERFAAAMHHDEFDTF